MKQPQPAHYDPPTTSHFSLITTNYYFYPQKNKRLQENPEHIIGNGLCVRLVGTNHGQVSHISFIKTATDLIEIISLLEPSNSFPTVADLMINCSQHRSQQLTRICESQNEAKFGDF
jgi:hypothetical protein